MPSKKTIIIGAGVAGIAASIRMALKGHAVEVFEANGYPGGKLSEIRQDGFRFDAGPSLLTMPQYIDELFTLAGKTPQDYFKYQRLDVTCRYFYPDGQMLTAYAETEKFTAEAAKFDKSNARALNRFFKNSKTIYAITHRVFLESSLHRIKTYLSMATVRSLLKLSRIDALRIMHRANRKFFKDDHLVQFYDRYATYNGSNPYQAPATLNVIPYLEQHFGAYFPLYGMYSITTALVELAKELGVKFNYNSPVEEIILERKKATGIRANGEDRHADIVISNADVWFTYHKLLRKYPALFPGNVLNRERSSSALIFYWGIKKQFKELDLHNIFFSADYKDEFDAVWKQKNICADPTVYINISSKFKADDAPEGCENWFVMINAPADAGQDWDKLISAVRGNMVHKISLVLGENIEDLIVFEKTLDPRQIESKTSSYQGSLYGNSSNSRFAAFLRHANKSSKIDGLYFCGGSVHPGGGIPLALLSAKIVSEWIS